ncbi:MAG: helix-turn-helix domain-containing protein [Lachnospiraceae bacterium]|nr:helix-turn-helix domain-containing protein [Lachnospiraceae bacterium]
MDEFMTPKMVSKTLHIGMNKTYKLFKLKDFPCVRISNQWLIKKDDLIKYMEKYRGSHICL